MDRQSQSNYRLVIVGEQKVGKTQMLNRLLHNSFEEQYITSVGVSSARRTFTRRGAPINCVFWDTTNIEQNQAFVEPYIKSAVGIYLIYSITDRNSFLVIPARIAYCKQINKAQLFLIGNKCDLDDQRVVSYEEGRQMAASYNLNFLETSARQGTNIELAFQSLPYQIFDSGTVPSRPATRNTQESSDSLLFKFFTFLVFLFQLIIQLGQRIMARFRT